MARPRDGSERGGPVPPSHPSNQSLGCDAWPWRNPHHPFLSEGAGEGTTGPLTLGFSETGQRAEVFPVGPGQPPWSRLCRAMPVLHHFLLLHVNFYHALYLLCIVKSGGKNSGWNLDFRRKGMNGSEQLYKLAFNIWRLNRHRLIYFNDSLILLNSDQKAIRAEIIYQRSHRDRRAFLFLRQSRQKNSDDSNNPGRINHLKMLWKSQA